MVDGAFDPLHHGHIEYFTRAREVGGAAALQHRAGFLHQRQASAAAAGGTAGGGDRRAEADRLHARQPGRYGNRPPRAAADALHQGQGLGREAATRAGAHLRGRKASRSCSSTPSATPRRSCSRRFSPGRNGHVDLAAFEHLVFRSRRRADALRLGLLADDWRQAGNVYTIEKRREDRRPPSAGHQGGLQPHPRARRRMRSRRADVPAARSRRSSPTASTSRPSTREMAPPDVRDRIMVGRCTEPTSADRTPTTW